MKTNPSSACPDCPRWQAQLEALQAENAQLREPLAAACKHSATLSKPPSSAIVKPKPADAGQAPRAPGGQAGHSKHDQQPFPPEQITLCQEHTLDACPGCGGPLRRNGPLAKGVQQVDIQQPLLSIEQHTCPESWCEHCRKPCWAPLPSHIVKGGLVGVELTVLIAFLIDFDNQKRQWGCAMLSRPSESPTMPWTRIAVKAWHTHQPTKV